MTASTDWSAALEAAGRQLATARRAEQQIRARVREQAIEAVADGISENQAAQLLGVDRMTVRAWLGK